MDPGTREARPAQAVSQGGHFTSTSGIIVETVAGGWLAHVLAAQAGLGGNDYVHSILSSDALK